MNSDESDNTPNEVCGKAAIIRHHLQTKDGRDLLLQSLKFPSEVQLSSKTLSHLLFSESLGNEDADTEFTPSVTKIVIPRSAGLPGTDLRVFDWVNEDPCLLPRRYWLWLDQIAKEINKHLIQELNARAKVSGEVVAPLTTTALDPILAKRFLLNARDYSGLRMFGRPEIEVESNSDILKRGIMGTYKDALLIVSSVIPVGTVYSTSTLGRMRCVVTPISLTLDEENVTLELRVTVAYKWDEGVTINRLEISR